MTGTDFEARTSAGALIATFGTPDQAAGWVEEHGPTYPGWRIERVRRYERRELLLSDEPERVAA